MDKIISDNNQKIINIQSKLLKIMSIAENKNLQNTDLSQKCEKLEKLCKSYEQEIIDQRQLLEKYAKFEDINKKLNEKIYEQNTEIQNLYFYTYFLSNRHKEYGKKIENMGKLVNEKQELRTLAIKNLDKNNTEKSYLEKEIGEIRMQLESYKKSMEIKKLEIQELKVYKEMFEEKPLPKGTPRKLKNREKKNSKKLVKTTDLEMQTENLKKLNLDILSVNIKENKKNGWDAKLKFGGILVGIIIFWYLINKF